MKAPAPACTICHGSPSIRVSERKPGSRGKMPISFRAEYRLCEACLNLIASSDAIERRVEARKRREEWIIVKARTLEWLQERRRTA